MDAQRSDPAFVGHAFVAGGAILMMLSSSLAGWRWVALAVLVADLA